MLMFPAILFLVLYFVIMQVVPTAQSISVTNKSIIDEEAKLVKTEKQLNDIQNFKSDIQSHSSEQEFVADFVPNDQREEILLSDIAQLAEETNIELFSVGFADGNSKTDIRTIEGKVIASGTYDNFKEFMNKLFLIKRLYQFKTFDLTKSEQGDEEDTEEEAEMILSGVVSFAYEYVPGMSVASPAVVGNSIDFDLITTVMDATTHTEPLKTETDYRANPFLP